MVADLQSTWDQEEAAAARSRLRSLAALVRERQTDEDSRRATYKGARKASREAHAALSRTIDQDTLGDVAYMEDLAQSVQQAEAAKSAEDTARREFKMAVARRQAAQEQLRTVARRQVERLPLFDRRHYAEEEEAPAGSMVAEVQVETARVPVDQVAPVNGKKKHSPEPVRQGSVCRDAEERCHRPGDRLYLVRLDQIASDKELVARLSRAGIDTLGDLAIHIKERVKHLEDHLVGHFNVARAAAFAFLQDVARWLIDNPPPAPAHERRCQECGCIEDECALCILRTGTPCQWSKKDESLCTACEVRPMHDWPSQRKQAKLKGEPIVPLGVSKMDLKAAYIGALFSGGTATKDKPAQVKPVLVNGRPYVVWGIATSEQGTAWQLLPLYDLDAYVRRFGGGAPGASIPLYSPTGTSYQGVTVVEGKKPRHKSARPQWIIGPESEGRTLVDQ